MSPLALLGWAGNVCFFSRFLVQWRESERAGRSVAPPLFWWLSLSGSAALGAYAASRGAQVLLVGYALNGLIYARNLALADGRRALRRPGPRAAALLAGAAALALATASAASLDGARPAHPLWLVCAVLGQAIWTSRFVLQWWSSERAGRSVLPQAFWWISLAGNLLLLAYALHLRDAVFVAGYLPGPLIQARNLMLEHTRRRAAPRALESAAARPERAA